MQYQNEINGMLKNEGINVQQNFLSSYFEKLEKEGKVKSIPNAPASKFNKAPLRNWVKQ